jgi:hypothetical protein
VLRRNLHRGSCSEVHLARRVYTGAVDVVWWQDEREDSPCTRHFFSPQGQTALERFLAMMGYSLLVGCVSARL